MSQRAALLLIVELALVIACRPAAAEDRKKAAVSSTGDATKPIVNEDYRFRIRWPGKAWRLLGREEIRRLIPDALAGAIRHGGVYGAVVVESAPGIELEPFARLLFDGMALQEKSLDEFQRTRFAGEDAIRMRVKGTANGIPALFSNTVFLHQDLAYQVISWGIAGVSEASEFQPFLDAFSILPGKVRQPRERSKARDTEGVGWRVRNGVFESAVTGIVAKPRGAWSLVVGGDLENMNADAEVGLQHTAPDAYLVLIPEPLSGVDRAALAAKLQSDVTASLGVEPGEKVWTARFASKPLEFRTFQTSTQFPLEFLHAVHFQGEVAVQVLAWYVMGLRERARRALAEGLASVEFHDQERRRKLAAEMLAQPDPENSAGPGFSLRGGVYRDFTHGFQWRKPRGFWRASAGERARAVNPAAALYIEEPLRGLHGLVISEEASESSVEDYHAAVVSNTLLRMAPAESFKLGDADALVSTGDAVVDGLELRYKVLTAVRGGKALQFLVWGFPPAVERERAGVDEALSRLRFAELNPTEQDGAEYRDLRLGFAVQTPGAGWRFAEALPPQLHAVGSFPNWSSGGDLIGVVAMCALEPGQDETWLLDIVHQTFRERLTELLSKPTQSESTLGGLPARRLTWKQGPASLEVFIVLHRRTFYALLLAGGASEAFDRARGSFRLLD